MAFQNIVAIFKINSIDYNFFFVFICMASWRYSRSLYIYIYIYIYALICSLEIVPRIIQFVN